MAALFRLTFWRALLVSLLAVAPAVSGQPINDHFTNRFTVIGLPATVTGSNNLATLEAGEPVHTLNGRRSVWWSWTAPASSRIAIETTSNSFNYILEVYTGNALTNLVKVAVRTALDSSPLTFDTSAGTEYQIAVTARSASSPGGTITLELMPPPPNDDFSNRTVLDGTSVIVTNANSAATAESGEPSHAGMPPGSSVWYSWTPPASGAATLDFLSSNTDSEGPFASRTNIAFSLWMKV